MLVVPMPSFVLLLLLWAGKIIAGPVSVDIPLKPTGSLTSHLAGPSVDPFLLLTERDLPFRFHNTLTQDLGGGWSAASQEYQAILPIDQAADVLADFYHSIVTICTAMVAQNAPLVPQGGTFHRGGLEFAFDSTVTPVPWTLIRAFADWMLLTTDLGFVSTYRMRLMNVATGQVIRFILRAGQGVPRLDT